LDKPVRTKWWVRARPEPEPAAPSEDLSAFTKPELAAIAESEGVSPEGTKAELVERLTDG
jgi:hypothetical protein